MSEPVPALVIDPATPAEPKASKKKRPIHEMNVGDVCAAVWRNTGTNGKSWLAVTFDRRYRGRDGKWKSTKAFGPRDLSALAAVVRLVEEWLDEHGEE